MFTLLLIGCSPAAADLDERVSLAWYSTNVECVNDRAVFDLPGDDIVTLTYRQATVTEDGIALHWTNVLVTDTGSDGLTATAVCSDDVTFTYAVVSDE